MVLTAEQLRAIMPRLTAPKSAAYLPFLTAAMREFAVDTPARAAAFLAQLAHESGQLRFMEEIWGPTDAQRRYEPVSTLATRLGNSEPGDGRRFKGRGPIQLTGRANYRTFGNLLGVDLLDDPARAALPEVAFRIAGLYWSKNRLNALADVATAAAFRDITKRINGGINGLADRQAFYETARRVLHVPDAPATRGGQRGPTSRSAVPVFTRGWEVIRGYRRRRPAAKAARRRSTLRRAKR